MFNLYASELKLTPTKHNQEGIMNISVQSSLQSEIRKLYGNSFIKIAWLSHRQ